MGSSCSRKTVKENVKRYPAPLSTRATNMDITKLGKEILGFTNARSVFLYGSRARSDFCEDSDYEIGVLTHGDKYVRRSDMKERFDLPNISIFPFIYEDFIAGSLDTPFVRSIFLNDIIRAGKTIAGEQIVENLKPPRVEMIDTLQEVRFNLGYALAATHSYRNGDAKTASLHFVKSCLFGTRSYVVVKSRTFFVAYEEILNSSKTLDLGEYQDLPIYAHELRLNKVELDEKNLFQNISYLNKLIGADILSAYNKEGNITLI